MYIERMLETIDGVVQDPAVPLAAVYWNVVPRDQRKFPLLVWQRASGGVFEGMRHDVARPVVRLALIADYDQTGCANFQAVERTRKEVLRRLLDAKVLSDWPDEPSDSYDEKLQRPRVDWLIALRGE